ncbi:MAG: calcium-binding protein [Solirubrobacteraceae bacterium]
MKRLLMMLLALTSLAAFSVAATTMASGRDHPEDDSTQACQTATGHDVGDDNGGDTESSDDRTARIASEGADDDQIEGTESDDHESGDVGDDEIDGQKGDDDLCGDEGDDHLQGGPGDDNLHGGTGNDVIAGQSGADDEFGEAGSDRISGGRGHDHLRGGRGRDHINSDDGVKDVVNCGPGEDTVRADTADAVASNCEHVSR